jgi:hypothetical protein
MNVFVVNETRTKKEKRMNMRVFGKVGFIAGISCAALGLAHLQSGSLRTAAPVAAVAAAAPAKAGARVLAGMDLSEPGMTRIHVEVFNKCEQTTKRMLTPAGLSDGLFDQR